MEIVWSSLWISKLFAKALPTIFQTLVGVISSGVKKYSIVIRALEVPISLGRRSKHPLVESLLANAFRSRVGNRKSVLIPAIDDQEP